MLFRLIKLALFVALLVSPILSGLAYEELSDVKAKTRFRGPGIVRVSNASQRVLIGNQEAGSVSVLDKSFTKVAAEYQVGSSVSAMECLGKSDDFLIADFEEHQVRLLIILDGSAKLIWSKPTVQFPNAIKVNSANGSVAITGQWSRQVQILRLASNESNPEFASVSLERTRTVELPFCPGAVTWITESDLFIADAFGDQWAVVNTSDGSMARFQYEGHRVGGSDLSNDGKWLVFSDQRLNPLARSTRNDVHWGLMISNQVSWVSVADILKAVRRQSTEGATVPFSIGKIVKSFPLGEPGDAKADPGGLQVSENGSLVITLGGVDEVAIGRLRDDSFAYVPVGGRPVDVAVMNDGSGEKAFVVNQFDESISVIRVSDFEVEKTVRLGATPAPDLVRKGAKLFFDAHLSHDNWMSCHSCHVEGHTNGMLNDNFSDESFGTPKRVISLLGHAGTLPLAWTGFHADLGSQIRTSVTSTMQGHSNPTDAQVDAISAFIQSLPAPVAVSVAREQVDLAEIEKGGELFRQLKCVRCHAPPTYTSPETYAVNATDEEGNATFNPPSLIGLGQRDRYFHDGRYKSLQDLFTILEHQLPRKLTESELSSLQVFLKSL